MQDSGLHVQPCSSSSYAAHQYRSRHQINRNTTIQVLIFKGHFLIIIQTKIEKMRQSRIKYSFGQTTIEI